MSQAPSNSFLDEDSFFSEMLSSQSDLEDQILLLKEVLNNDRCVEDKLGELQNFLSSSSIRNAPIDILDEKIFNTALDGAQKIYFEIINSVNEMLQNKQNNSTDDIRNQLNVLLNLLKCWDLCITHIKALEKISIIDIKSFPTSLFEVMIDAIGYCKNSAKDYGDYFQSVSELLTSLFRQCVNTLNSFYALLDAVILFDTNEENDMNILLKIIDCTGKLATLTSGMDAKTLTDMWKRFGKLATTYGLEMKGISPSTISCHFKGLAESIVIVLSSITQKNQRSSNERPILCCRVLLKILEKLSETYCGWIRSDIMIGIIIMLTDLYKYTEQCLKVNGYNTDFIKFVASNFTFMFEPFLDVVFKNDTFKVAFFDYGKSVNEDAIGYHLLLLTIMKTLSMLPYETQREWCTKEYCILDACFQNIDRLTKDICVGKLEVQMSKDITQGSYLAKIYEATCLSIFVLVCQISNQDFEELVTLLLRYLLNGKFFASLLSTDIWCFVCRLGSSEMCYSHFRYLVQVYEMLEERKNNFNVVMLSNLLSRQYILLSDKDKIDFIQSIEKNSTSHKWSLIVRMMDAQKKKQLQQQIGAFALNTQISTDLKNLEDQPSLNNLTTLVKDLSIIEATDIPQDEQSVDTFIKMWNKVVYTLGDCKGAVLLLLENLTTSLIHSTSLQQGQTRYITSVLESMASLYPYASNSLRIEFCWFFGRCAAHLTDSDSSVVAEIFCRLLSDADPCVQQQAFESFEHLTHACPNAGLLSSVAMAIKNAQSEVSRTLPAYISGEVAHELVGFANTDEFFSALCDVIDFRRHVCSKRTQSDRDEKLIKLDVDAKDSGSGLVEDSEIRAGKVCADVELLLKSKEQLKLDTCDRLREVFQRFLNQCDR